MSYSYTNVLSHIFNANTSFVWTDLAMYYQQEKYNKLTIICILFALIVGMIGMIKSFQFFILLAFIFIGVSLITESLSFFISFRKIDSLKQMIRAILIIILSLYLLIKLLKGS